MERTENTQDDVIEVEDIASRTFIFSEPNILCSPETVNAEVILEQVSDASVVPNVFTFTAPTAVSQASNHDASVFHSNMCDKQYKPKISRNTYKPAVNVFAQALKDTAMFEHLKKNSRSQVAKINPENSITCSNVPQSLLTKVAAKEYFMLFGNLLKIAIRPKKQIITVTYATKEEACVAYEKSGDYLGEKFHIEWTKLCLHAMMSQKYTRPGNYKERLDGMLPKKHKLSQSKGTKSTTRVEKASAKSDKLKSDSQITYLSPNATTEELQSIICQPAHTSEDKYKVLEARDRLIRMKQVKSHTLEAAKVMAGTCPDMCPEKERLMRESKRQVALYELLETNEYRVNHAVAVKQYSRSSADQEEPMAHDLRPVKSLKMTMSYLLHEIGNLCDQPGTNLGEWYHFLWDRTRGIRKDITQQELCCTSSVELVEQCARFHIVCSERLCAEEASVFDKRINSDNLTKCLQSLKYMYHDLRVKGINCKNEPEFRTYIILLNLNNGNFMWDLQRLPKNVQKSAEVRFALKVYSALESNNYYKFFKLVRKTTYLNACILLRYFNQVRLKALSIMVKAYCRTTSTAYPLYELIDILGFEDENEAIYFCEQIGLNASKDELHVLLNRQNFTMPVLNIKQNRACNIIESKRTMQQLSIGECIAGGKMPERTYKYHKPHNSFDSHGFLMPGSINAQDQSESPISTLNDPYEFIEDDVMETKKSTSISEKSYNKTESTVTNEHTNMFKSVTSIEPTANVFAIVKSDTNASFTSTHETQIKESQKNVNLLTKSKAEKEKDSNMFSFAQKQQDVSLNVNKSSESCTIGNAFDTTTSSKTSNILSKSFEPSLNNDAASPFSIAASKSIFSGTPQENIFMKNLAPSTIFSNTYSNAQTVPKSSNVTNATTFITNNKLKGESFLARAEPVQKQSVKETTAEDLKLKEQEHVKNMEQIKETAEQILNTIQAEVIQTDCSDIVGEKISRINICNTLSEDINNQISSEVTNEICNSILTEEIINTQKLHEVSMKIKNRIIMRYFNIWKSNILIKKQQRKALDSTPVWLQKYSSGQCAKVLYLKKQDLVIRNMCKRRGEQEPTKCYIESLAPIEVIIYIGIKENLKSLDVNMHSNYYWKLVISWPDLHNKSILWHHKKIMNQYLYPNDHTLEPIIKLYQPNQSETLHICIRHFEGLIRDHNVVGSDALLFIATASEETKFVIKRLTKTILSRDRLMPIPLVFIILGDANVKIQEKEIAASLEKMLKCGYLSTYTIMYEKDLTEKTILNMTQSAVLWLTINKSPPNPLEMDYLQDIYDICLTEELWLRILDDSFFNKKLSCALKEPKFIIDLHNEAVTYLIDIILDPESFMYTKFAPELKKYISNEYMMPCSYEHFDDTWKKEDYKVELEKVMFSFKLPQWRYGWPISDNNTLHRCITKYCQEALFDSNDDQPSCGILSNLFFTSGVATVSNFIDVLLYIVKKKVYLLNKDMKVIYNKDYIKHFRILPWWLKSSLLTEYKIVLEQLSVHGNVKRNDNNGPIVKKRKVHKLEENDVKPDPLATFCENSRSQVMDVHCTLKKVEDRLTAQRQQSFLFEERLKNALYSKVDSA
ncbi:RRM_XMAS2 and SAC3_GANP domain-containing protein xmas isoform X2 [Andrena cerasifolii]|uniref:RRM_XMAS2 and SAC3_GANP domain-containing protein xmas isoform X2 n=1 Tax=Andrena cerasifolii TaxID=2819439 RepID=UPI004037BF6B